MSNAIFEVGVNEKHLVEIQYGAMTGKIKILVDGEPKADSYHLWLGPKKFSFQIGNSELHRCEIRTGYYGKQIQLLVDGKLHSVHDGVRSYSVQGERTIIQREIVRIPCNYCKTLVDPIRDKNCSSCGAPIKL